MKKKLLRLVRRSLVSFWIVLFATCPLVAKEATPAQLFKAKNYQKVVDLLQPKLESLQPSDLLLLGKSHSFLKNHDSAIRIYQTLVAQEPKNFEVLTLLGGELLTIKKDKEALGHLKDALAANPKHRLAYQLLIQYYERKKNKYELRLLYEDMISNIGESNEAIAKLCELCANDRLYDLAFKYCKKGIQKNPKQPENYVFLGHSYKDTGDLEKAKETFKKAADIFSKSTIAQLTYANYLSENKDHLNAYNYFKRAVLADPQSIEGKLGQATTALELQKFEESLALFEQTCKSNKTALSAFRKGLSGMRAQKNNSMIKPWLDRYEASLSKCEGF